MVTWRSKKESVVSRSSPKSELRALALTICEEIWVRQIMIELRMKIEGTIKLKCDNQAIISMS